MHRILVVEDDPIIAAAIKKHIESWGCEVSCVSDFANVMGEFAAFDPQLVMLDISLPYYNGYHWCGEIRRVSTVPVIFISSASDNMNIVMAINMGADDFISKPFDLNVLTAKVQAILRRAYDFGVSGSVLSHAGAVLSLNDSMLSYGGSKVELTKNEFRILDTLMEHRGELVSRDTLMMRLWETDSFVDENTLTVNVARLRRKLESVGLNEFIRTRKGQGYIVENKE